MLGARHEIARLQSDFYRDQFRKMLRWLMCAMIIIFVLAVAVIYSIFVQPPQTYYGNTSEGKLLHMPNGE